MLFFDKLRNEYITIETMMGSRLFLIMATVCVSLKLDGYSSWTWREVFWWYWVYLSICVGVAFAVMLMTISKMI